MGKKKDNKKKKNDYWDEEFEEDAALVEGDAPAAAEGADGAEEGGDSDDGLMAMMNKAAKSKAKKNKKKKQLVESDDDYNEPPAIPAPAAGDDDDDDEYMVSMASNKKNKKKKNKLDIPLPLETKAAQPEEEPTRILTKKEKEKLKKERAKEAKRLAAEEKKKQQAAEDAEFDRLLGDDASAAGADDNEPAAKSKNQLKKEKQKKKAAAAAAGDNDDEPAPAAAAAPVAAPPAKGKKGKAGVAALRKMLEAQKAAEEEAKRKEEEERLIREEEERREAEEEARREAARQAKKERERLKKEQLRKDGKLLTKAQKEAQRKAQLRHEQLIASGQVKIAALENDGAEPAAKPKRIVYSSKKKKGPSKAELEKQKEEEERKRKEEEERKRKEEEEAKKKQEVEESSDDDWEKAADTSEDEEVKKEDDDNVKSDWDAESEEEEKEEEKKPAAKPAAKSAAKPAVKPAPAKGKGKQPVVEESSDEESEEESDDDDSDEDSDEYDSDEYDSDEDSSDEELTNAQKQALIRKEEAAARRAERQKAAMAARSKDDLRSPICCILGHVDTGKTKLLDKIRQTNVQEGEAGGITQQIGATYFPAEAIAKKTAVLGADKAEELKVPGLLVIDTPGHESFTNLRSRGSSLCNIAILVVDIMHGLEPQTIESIRLLRDRRTPFIVALNKIDRLFQWEATPDNSFLDSLAKQKKSVQEEFDTRVKNTMLQFAEQGFNAELYYRNKNFAKYVSLVPTSAHTGEGIPDMLNLLVNLTQSRMSDKLMYITELECTVLEVKVIEGLGTTIDVVLVNGWLREGDKIVVCGLNGPIVTQVRALLTPQPLRELRVKSQYQHHKEIKAAMGIKISAPDLEKAIAGSRLLVCGPDDDEEELMEEVMSDLTDLMSTIDRTGHGVWVQASTLGALEALLEFLRTSKIPVAGINIGPVHKKDVVRASVMLEKAREYAVMLCFDVKVDNDARDMAEELGMKIFTAEIIYHLFDRFVEYRENMLEQKRKDQAPSAVFPCVLKMVPGAIFNKKDPIIIGVDVIEGALRVGTPLCVSRVNPDTKEKEVMTLGKVTSIEQNHKTIDIVKKGQAGGGVAIKIECAVYETPKTFGRHLEEKDEIYSRITRASIDVLKESFRKDMSKEDWALIVKLKKVLNVD